MPYEYEPDELLDALRAEGARLVTDFFRPEPDTDYLIKKSVEGNTFRSFRKHRPRPSEVYRAWAQARMTFGAIGQLGDVATAAELDELAERRFVDLRSYWIAHTRQELAYGPGRKLVNLLHKWIVRDTGISAPDRDRVVQYLHSPHDLYCLAAVRKSAQTGQYGVVFDIPLSASMGFITTADQYAMFQTVVGGIARAANVPPICVDLLSWDKAHGL